MAMYVKKRIILDNTLCHVTTTALLKYAFGYLYNIEF